MLIPIIRKGCENVLVIQCILAVFCFIALFNKIGEKIVMTNLLSELTQVTVLFLISRPQQSPLDHQTLHLLLLCDFCSLRDNLLCIADDSLVLRSY